MARMRAQKDGFWDRLWFSPEQTANHEAYNEARIDSGLLLNHYPNEAFLPSSLERESFWRDIDAIQNSALAATGYLGATALNADAQTRSQLTRTLANLSNAGASFLLPRISLTPGGAFGVTSVGVADDLLKPSGVAKAPVTSGGTANAATASQLTDSLAAKMEKPIVQDSRLSSLMDDLYRDGAKIGSGSTADAVRHELATGQPVGGVWHTQKAQDYSIALTKWLKDNPNAPFGDRSAATNVLRDLQNALKGK